MSKFETLKNKVIEHSSESDWNSAVNEWDIVDFGEDMNMHESCICTHPNIKNLYTIKNRITNHELTPIGSECIKKFGREDLRNETNIYEQLFKLVNAKRDGKFIELKGKDQLFSKKLIDYLNSQNVFSITGEYEQYNNYEILRKLFNQRKEMTYKQKRLATRIIVSDVFAYLDREIESKVKTEIKQTENETESNDGINKLIELKKKKKHISIDEFSVESVEQMEKENVFSVSSFNGNVYNYYEIMMKLVKQEYPLSNGQLKMYSRILLTDIMPYLDKCIGNEKQVETPIKEVEKADIKIEDLPF